MPRRPSLPPSGRLDLVEADLLAGEAAFTAAFRGCRTVFHCASPFFIDAADPQAQLVEPAVAGTRAVMAAAAANKADVRRVVLTSSCAGAGCRRWRWRPCGHECLWASQHSRHCSRPAPSLPFSDPAAIKGRSAAPPKVGATHSEADWNEASSVEGGEAYWVSKVAAERAAWELAALHGLDLVTILPGAGAGQWGARMGCLGARAVACRGSKLRQAGWARARAVAATRVSAAAPRAPLRGPQSSSWARSSPAAWTAPAWDT